MSAEREPKFSWSGGSLSAGAEVEPRGSVPPWDATDTDTHLAVSPPDSFQGVGVKSLDDRCRDKSRTPVGFRVLGGFVAPENRDNLATGTETFLPFRAHEQATDVNIFTAFTQATKS